MKTMYKLMVLIIALYSATSQAWLVSAAAPPTTSALDEVARQQTHDAWLKDRFSQQHQSLVPVVAVADMFFSCNKVRQVDNKTYSLKVLITEMDKNTLAEKLSVCLGDDTMQSDVALNFGLLGCFHDQLAHLSNDEQAKKMQLVEDSIAVLSQDERKKSFTQCVTEQSIHYLK